MYTKMELKSKKEKYRNFCINKNISVFGKDWWLDSVCGEDNWDVCLVENDEGIIASLPYYRTRKIGFNIISMPVFTQTMGLYIKYPSGLKRDEKLSYEKKILDNLMNQIPSISFFQQSYKYTLTNWLPFYWKGYNQTTRYTYLIEDIINLEQVFDGFSRSKKKNIKKSEKIVSVKFDLPAKEFYQNHRETLSKQNKVISYDFDTFNLMYKNAYKNDSGRTIYAVDENNNIHAALFVIWDLDSAYNLISTIDPLYRNSGANSLLIKEIIKFTSVKTKNFDFCGSMIENVEHSIRKFGGIQKPYFEISKSNSRSYSLLKKINGFIKVVM